MVAASAGNHAQGVAYAASLLGIPVRVYMPVGASIAKLTATRAYGADVHLVGDTLDESLVAARAYAAETGAVLVHPFDHLDVLRGQGTVGLEILEQVPDVATVVVGLGGGGLLSGVAAALRAVRPEVRIVGVQAEQAAAWPGSLAAGKPVRLYDMSTLADGIAVGEPTPLTFEHVSALVDDVVTVSEDQMARAMLLLLERAKLVVEPAGVASVAAVASYPERFTAPVVAVLSGGNIDPLLLLHMTEHGLVAAGRFLSLRVEISDRPGSLARLLAWSANSARAWSTCGRAGSAAGSNSATSRSICGWRPGGTPTGTSWWPGSPRPGTGSSTARSSRRQPLARRSQIGSSPDDRAAQPLNGTASTMDTFWVLPLGSTYSRDSPRLAPRMAWPSGDCGEYTCSEPCAPSSREPNRKVSWSSSSPS